MVAARSDRPTKRLLGIVSVYVLFFVAFAVLGSNQVIGLEPLIAGWIPAWLAATYALAFVFMAFTVWVMDSMSQWVVGEETAPLLGWGSDDEPTAAAHTERE